MSDASGSRSERELLMRQVIAGNWKMNGLTADAEALTQALRDGLVKAPTGAEVVVFPPFTQVATVGRILAGSGIAWGGQDCHIAERGAHTGDIAPEMLRDLGATHVILGHSERRRDHGELDETVREKTVAALKAGLIPIVCVGESEDQRAGGQQQDTVGWQIKGSLPDGFGGADGSGGIVAYEPVWAIGTGRTATVEDIAAMQRLRPCRAGPPDGRDRRTRHTHPVRWLGECRQCRKHPGSTRGVRRPGRRCEPEAGRLPHHRVGRHRPPRRLMPTGHP